jgi:hypothetical protein
MSNGNRFRVWPLFLSLLSLAGCAGGSSVEPQKSRFEREFERYLSLPHQKAIALAGDIHGEWTYGYGCAFRSKGPAIDMAFEECHRRMRTLERPSQCRLYAVGNEIVEGDAELEARYGRD